VSAAESASAGQQAVPNPESSLDPARSQLPAPVQLARQETRADTHQAAIEELAEKANSQHDDWPTEVLSEAASAQLGRVAKLLEQPNLSNRDLLKSVAAGDFGCRPLRPKNLREVYGDGAITVRRSEDQNQGLDGPELSGLDGFHQALTELHAALRPEDDTSPSTNGHPVDGIRHVKFKLYRIESSPADLPATQQRQATFQTLVRYEASIHDESPTRYPQRQQTADWNCRWTYPRGDQMAPLLTYVAPANYEESEVVGAPTAVPPGLGELGGPLFVDCTESALASNACYRQQVLPGIPHWLARTPRELMGLLGYNGLAVGDVNGDGLDDLYVCDAGGLPNRLYVQQPDGTARDIASEAGVDFLDDSSSALLIDLDNDDDQDLAVAIDTTLQIAENDGTGRFTLHPPLEMNTDSMSLSAADYDGDGLLDLYVCGYRLREPDPSERGLPFPVPYFDANNGGRNVLLRNEGGLRFADATRETGLDVNNTRFSFAAAWEDFDNDGDQDLYVANDFGRNNLYQNSGGHFTDIAAAAGVEDQASGMSVSWDDFDRDGRMDLYVGNMWSSAGNRVTYQPKFSQGKTDVMVNQIRRMARGNTLFRNASGGGMAKFDDVSEEQAVELGRWAWSSKFADLTNDGWPDLIVANGFVSGYIPDDL
jgi:hypothetical protein